MRVLKINRTRVSKRALAEAAMVLAEGGVVAFPTETAYGLAADPTNPKAVARVFEIKGRPEKMPLPLVAATPHDIVVRFVFSPTELTLARKHWPGPFTMVLQPRRAAGLISMSSDGAAAVRLPKSAWARAVADAAGGLATSTSANISGEPALYSGRAVMATFKDRRLQPDLLLDAGPLPKRAPSTIVRVRKGKRGAPEIEVLRQGAVRVTPPAKVR
jgi:L-threonylcarbamoyladenylate synthase